MKNEKVTEAKLNIHGKIVNVIFNVKEDTSLDDAKKIASESLEKFSDDVKNFYDIEYIIWAQDVAETGNRSYMKALNPLLKEGGNV